MIKTEKVLRELPFFSGLSEKDLKIIISSGREVKYKKGDIIFSDGDLCHAIYVVEEGEVKLYKLGDDGKEHILHFAEPGDTFGGAPIFLEDGRYPAYAEAKTNLELLLIPKVMLLKLIRENHDITLKVLHSFSKYLNLLVETVNELSLESVLKRVIKYLIKISKDGIKTTEGIVVLPKLTREELAAKLGTVREVLSRTLSLLNKKGLIGIKDKKIIIPDIEKLKEI